MVYDIKHLPDGSNAPFKIVDRDTNKTVASSKTLEKAIKARDYRAKYDAEKKGKTDEVD